MKGCKLWLRATLSPSVMRNTLLGQCFHTRNEKSHKEIFDLFQPFLQACLFIFLPFWFKSSGAFLLILFIVSLVLIILPRHRPWYVLFAATYVLMHRLCSLLRLCKMENMKSNGDIFFIFSYIKSLWAVTSVFWWEKRLARFLFHPFG